MGSTNETKSKFGRAPISRDPRYRLEANRGSDKVVQEFFCRTSRPESPSDQKGCGGYVVVKINVRLNGIVIVVCPKCGHRHQRMIKDGFIGEAGRFNGDPIEEITPLLSAWSQEPRSATMAKKRNEHIRNPRTWDASVIKRPEDLARQDDPISRAILRESMFERFGAREDE